MTEVKRIPQEKEEIMQVHELKTVPPYFQMVIDNRKHFEYRRNDRIFGLEDLLFLREYKNGKYTGRTQLVKVIEIVNDRTIGIPDEYVIMEIRKVSVEYI